MSEIDHESSRFRASKRWSILITESTFSAAVQGLATVVEDVCARGSCNGWSFRIGVKWLKKTIEGREEESDEEGR